ncbi:MAG: LytTR family DNA-binding domain-containing protein [Bacteroidota bacterium]
MNILIIEDERRTAQLLQEMIEAHPEHLVVQTCDSVETSVAYLKRNQSKLELIFMDIQLADGDSFQIFDQVEITTPVVFCTAYDQYMLQAFQTNGIAYLLKPFEEKDIAQAFAKVAQLRDQLAGPSVGQVIKDTLQPQESARQHSFLVRYREKMYPLSVSDIAFGWLDQEVLYVYNFSGERHILLKKMDEFQEALPDTDFYRINRQMVVHRKAIKEIEPYYHRKVVVTLTFPIPEKAVVSRLKVTPFLDWVERT